MISQKKGFVWISCILKADKKMWFTLSLYTCTCTCIINLNFFFFVSVNDYEDQIQKKTQDMDQQVQLVSDLDSEVKRLQVSHTDYWKSMDKNFLP